MVIVDSHCHATLAWYEPVEALLFQMDRYGVDHAVLIQIRGQADNSYHAECLQRYPGRFASVVVVDTSKPEAAEELARLAEQGASGVRFDATARSPGDDPLAIWRAAERLGMAVSCFGSSADFASDAFAALVASVPNLKIVIEHLGSVSHPETNDTERQQRLQAPTLARFPNCYIKVPGLGEFCQRASPVAEPFPFVQPIPPYLAHAYAAFGPSRMMWGSDYPPVSGREGYGSALRLTMEQFADKSEDDRRLIFGAVAQSVFFPQE